MKILSFIAVSYLLAMPSQASPVVGQGGFLPRPTKCPLGLHRFILTAESGSHRFMAAKLREYIDFNRDKDAWEARSMAITMRYVRDIYPADRYAELLDVSPEELQSFENGTAIPNGLVLDNAVKNFLNQDIIDYLESHGSDLDKRLEQVFGTDRLEVFVERIQNMVMTEVFLVSFIQALQEAEEGSDKAAQEIAILEDGLKLDYPNAPYTFTELIEEAKPVVKKLRQDSQVVGLQFDELSFRKIQELGKSPN